MTSLLDILLEIINENDVFKISEGKYSKTQKGFGIGYLFDLNFQNKFTDNLKPNHRPKFYCKMLIFGKRDINFFLNSFSESISAQKLEMSKIKQKMRLSRFAVRMEIISWQRKDSNFRSNDFESFRIISSKTKMGFGDF
jgi:hypothetical protein